MQIRKKMPMTPANRTSSRNLLEIWLIFVLWPTATKHRLHPKDI